MQLQLGESVDDARRRLLPDEEEPPVFVCDVVHHCPRSHGPWYCMLNRDEHPLEGEHFFGTTCCGAHVAYYPHRDLHAIGCCDLASTMGRGYALVNPKQVRDYPLDPESGSPWAVGLVFTGYCPRDGGRLWGIADTPFEACQNPTCAEGRGVILDFEGASRAPRPAPRRSVQVKPGEAEGRLDGLDEGGDLDEADDGDHDADRCEDPACDDYGHDGHLDDDLDDPDDGGQGEAGAVAGRAPQDAPEATP